MAKIAETVIVIKASKLLRDGDESIDVLDGNALAQLTAVIEELAGSGVLIEIETLDGQ
mgnify:CR=1 FL=1|jgi:hypothetical protein|tara:strand:- start:202 stop:375 length:174 start_codon:yes stop_codon:yes gene_type:complete